VELHGKDAMPNRLKDEVHYEETAWVLLVSKIWKYMKYIQRRSVVIAAYMD
jgi:hypothetical protein